MDYQKIYLDLIKKRRNNPITHGYKENHHILPTSLGGDNSSNNLVYLTGREHWIAHLLLHKIYKKPETAYACHMMAANRKKRGVYRIRNSRTYEAIRKEHSLYISELGKQRIGDKNGSYGTIWISDRKNKINKKINKNQEIPIGWEKGRSVWNKPKGWIEQRKEKADKIYETIKNCNIDLNQRGWVSILSKKSGFTRSCVKIYLNEFYPEVYLKYQKYTYKNRKNNF